MKERPILFKDEMVRAILDGRKTQTRRLVDEMLPIDEAGLKGPLPDNVLFLCPYGKPGDRLWVREAWRIEDRGPIGNLIFYRADPGIPFGFDTGLNGKKYAKTSTKYRPSIHLPRWASRISLEIQEVRVQRLQGISEEDSKAEGVSVDHTDSRFPEIYKLRFRELWDSINAKSGNGWEKNPWVWALTFKRL